MCFKSRLLLALPLFFAAIVCGQRNAGSIHGNVVKPDGNAISGAVKVTLKVVRGDQMIAFTDQEGRFDLPNVTPGEYTIEADPDRERNYAAATERVQVWRGSVSLVTIYLKEKKSDKQAS